ncbi:MAG: tRNA 2-thiouridine(34) synthase MnmA [Treponema sp.]|jgi:tRNA-specific 2-thiouridylase|nr:tRNA 2-thiouridine(34) synthase MnmA [Treponema sp.]
MVEALRKKAVVAMSGGVDSSVAAALMKERGFECIGVTMKLFATEDISGSGEGGCCSGTAGHASSKTSSHRGCCSLNDVEDARAVAFRMDMPHYVLNFSDEFKTFVIDNFIETYRKGATPNPCIECNRRLKFEKLLLRAQQLDFDYIVTGHYAQIERSGDRFLLKKALDSQKDQSYVLYAMTQEQLKRTVFPLGGLSKPEVREIARTCGFINAAKRDSQDICFVPNGDYAEFIESYTGASSPKGDVIDKNGAILGVHRGIVRYTIGQRRGLGLAFNSPRYVVAKSAENNSITLGEEKDLYVKTLVADNVNLIARDVLDRPLRVTVKTRYLQKERRGTVEQTGPDAIRIVFDEPQRAITPGQAAVFYDGDLVVGGGTIRQAGTFS